MGPSARSGSPWWIAALGALVVLWFGLSGLLVVARGDPEALLRTTFGRHGRADAFEHLNGISVLFWLVHSSLVLTAIAAARYRQSDVLAVLLIGPVIALAIGLLGQTWLDPNGFVVVAVCTIGWLVGTVVGGVYWRLKRKGTSAACCRQSVPFSLFYPLKREAKSHASVERLGWQRVRPRPTVCGEMQTEKRPGIMDYGSPSVRKFGAEPFRPRSSDAGQRPIQPSSCTTGPEHSSICSRDRSGSDTRWPDRSIGRAARWYRFQDS